MNHTFQAIEQRSGTLFEQYCPAHLGTIRMFGMSAGENTVLNAGSYLIFQLHGSSIISEIHPLSDLCSAAVNATTYSELVRVRSGFLLLIECPNYRSHSVLTYQGIEREGRLRYIDGCTDTLLIPPARLGDPCLNHLHFPANTNQTMHTHPTMRLGVVVRGRGECVTPFGNVPLVPGMIFAILPEGEGQIGLDHKLHPAGSHCFRTFEDTMDVVAFHPDSDYGPTDENHPMINRTIVNGVSASTISEIRTR